MITIHLKQVKLGITFFCYDITKMVRRNDYD